MDRSSKMLLTLACAALLGVAHTGHARILITISDGQTTKGPGGTVGDLVLEADSPDAITTLNFLQCASPPCTVYFPSGRDSEQSGDTFMFTDDTAAQVKKTDSDSDRLQAGGMAITALTSGKRVLTFKFQTEKGDLQPGTGGSTSYPLVAFFNGQFLSADGMALPAACPPPPNTEAELSVPCAKLQLETFGTTPAGIVDGEGLLATATTAIPCGTPVSRATPSPSPCGALWGGGYYPSGGFQSEDRADITCPSGCEPWHVVTISAEFREAGETLLLYEPPVVAVSSYTSEEFGLEFLLASLANRLTNPWGAFTAADELYRATPYIDSSAGTITIGFGLQKGMLVAANRGVALTSVGTDQNPERGDGYLPATEQARNNASYVTYIPRPRSLPWKDVRELTLRYDYGMGESDTADLRLPKRLKFSDCLNGSFRLRVALTDDKDVEAGILNVYLGSSGDFRTGCAAAAKTLAGQNLVKRNERRVDASQLDARQKCCISFSEAQRLFGHLFVRSISVVVDRGIPAIEQPVHFKVDLRDAIVNGARSRQRLATVDPKRYQPLSAKNLPVKGSSLVLTNVSKQPFISTSLPDGRVQIVGDRLQAQIKAEELPGGKSGTYRANLCLFGGRCVPLQGEFTVK